MTETILGRKYRALPTVRLPQVAPVRLEGDIDVEQLALFSENGRPEHYWFDAPNRRIKRTVTPGTEHGRGATTTIARVNRRPPAADMSIWADSAYLRRKHAPPRARGPELRVVDLFAGCGAMSLGVAEACRALGYRFVPAAAFDIDSVALEVYAKNFGIPVPEPLDLGMVLRRRVGAPMQTKERSLKRKVGSVDLVVAGPPCQGHSNLNNKTRRNDPKNRLYFSVARFAELLRPRWIIVENVITVLHDKGRVVQRTKNALLQLGYAVEDGIVDLWKIGVPQSRRRHLLVASLGLGANTLPAIPDLVRPYLTRPRTVRWAIDDLERVDSGDVINSPTKPKPVTKRRINYLFDKGLYDLPDHQRPDCHKLKAHTYQAVYGRLRWDQVAPTITGGFDTMGRGRFVHPTRRRTLTPHEAARLQFIPDFFDFSPTFGHHTALAELIGNAVPPKLSYVIAMELLRRAGPAVSQPD